LTQRKIIQKKVPKSDSGVFAYCQQVLENSAFHMAQFIAPTPAATRTFLQNIFIHHVSQVTAGCG
jgi:hypothetical protein